MVDFVHLHLHTTYSILDGMIRVDDLIRKVKEMGMDSVAITDHGSISGAITFYDKARENGIKPIIGAELYITHDRRFKGKQQEQEDVKVSGYHLVLLAKNFQGYKNLVKLVTLGNLEGFYYKPRIDKEVLSKYSEGLIMLTSCLAGEIPQAILYEDNQRLKKNLDDYISIFGKENVFVEFQYHGIDEQIKVNTELIKIAKSYGLKRVITNDSHYLNRENYEAHDILLCVQTKKKIDDPKRLKFKQNEFYLKSFEELYKIWGDDFNDAFLNTKLIAEMVDIQFPENIYYLPQTENSFENLKELCYRNLPKRYPDYDSKVLERLEYELSVIRDMGFSDYFLIVSSFIEWARSSGIPVGPGRGSVGGSIVAYLIGITQIDPLKYSLIFERFLNPGRKSMPDIDTDFCQIRRDEVIDYCIEKYGRSKVCNIGTFGTMKARAAVRDVARVLGFPPSFADHIAKMIPFNYSIQEALEENIELKKGYHNDKNVKKIIDIAIDLEGLIRNQSVHAAGVIISSIDIDEMIPLVKNNDVIATAYDMSSVERLGFVKMDFLGLRTLTLIDDTVKMIKKVQGKDIDVYNLPLNDKKTFDLLCNGDTVGVFQVESPGFKRLLKELKPTDINDIISALALYRPGPLESGLVKNFIEAKHDPSKIKYLHPDLEEILRETYGVIVYQEQIMMIANKFASFTLSQADDLRKAMGKKKPEIMEKYRQTFIEGCINNGYSKEIAQELFDIIEKFAGYGFNKSHSAAYGILTYITAYLKANYLHEYLACLLKSVEGNPKKIRVFLRECFEKNIKVLPPDINKSNENFDIEIIDNQKVIRYGFLGIKGLGEAVVNEVIKKRTTPFMSIEDFANRVNHQIVNKKAFEIMILSGFFDSIYPNRRELLDSLDQIINKSKSKVASLFSNKTQKRNEERIRSNDDLEILQWEKEFLGVYLSDHPLNKLNIKIDKTISALKDSIQEENFDNKEVKVVGVITNLQEKITKKGKMAIFELDDPSDSIEVVVYPSVFQENSEKIKEGKIVVVEGEVVVEGNDENEDEEKNSKIICQRIYDINEKNDESNPMVESKKFANYKINFFVQIAPDFIEEEYYKFVSYLSSFFKDQGEMIVNFEIYQNDRYEVVYHENKFLDWDSYFTISKILENNFPNLKESIRVIPELISL